ncbi:MAG: GNAT family N-acetyltransferase [Acidobacteria bacterium]|nr:GNAT family N-acetyltransferase [Acidobacteriota bacterium]
MHTEFRRALVPKELRSLLMFDHKAFHEYPGDWFHREDWETFEPWWLLVNNRKVGCCAFESHVDFQQDVREDGENPHLHGSLYIATTGILPAFRCLGFGTLLKSWQLSYARLHGFHRVVTNSREGNLPMIKLNRKFGFKVLRTTPGYYAGPPEPTVVMELRLR